MNAWVAALIPLGIIMVLGAVAFFSGYRQRPLSRVDDTDEPHKTVTTAKPMPAEGVTASASTAGHDQLRKTIGTSDRLLSRAPDERAILVQFLDVEAPEAASVHRFIAELRHEFQERISFAARHFPATASGHTTAAALEAAERQGKFDDFLNELLPPDDRLEDPKKTQGVASESLTEKIDRIARELGMDSQRFAEDMASSSTAALIAKDRREAKAAGITHAPSLLLLDGRQHNVLTSLEDFRGTVADAAAAPAPSSSASQRHNKLKPNGNTVENNSAKLSSSG